MTSEKKNRVLYWLFTAPFALIMLMSGSFYLMESPQVVEGIMSLGYPLYLLKILGVAKSSALSLFYLIALKR